MIEEAIFTEETIDAPEKPALTLEQRMDACAKTIRAAFDTNDMDLLKYALNKYQVNLRIFPAEEQASAEEPTPPSHQSSATDALLADPEE